MTDVDFAGIINENIMYRAVGTKSYSQSREMRLKRRHRSTRAVCGKTARTVL